jgi:predicted ATP-dependent endonuclease of OLD family
MGHDLFCEGICCVEYSTVGGDKFIKLADQLGIDWMIVADRDRAGDDYIRTANGLLDGRPAARHILQLDHGPMEVFLCMEGCGPIYEANISPQKKGTITASAGTPEYWNQVVKAQADKAKPRVVLEAMLAVEQRGAGHIPSLLKMIIETALRRSGEAA